MIHSIKYSLANMQSGPDHLETISFPSWNIFIYLWIELFAEVITCNFQIFIDISEIKNSLEKYPLRIKVIYNNSL